MSNAFQYVLSMSLAASMLVGAVMIFRLIFKKTPRYIMCIMWALVGLRLICPLTLESPLSLIPSSLSPSDNTVISGGLVDVQDKLPIENESPEIGQQPSIPTVPKESDAVSAPQSPSTAVNNTEKKSGIDVLEVCSIVWLCGTAAMLAYAGISYTLIRRKVSASARVNKGIYECDSIDSPFILGIIFPKIYLPSELSEGREHVIAHERAHIRRLDHIWKPLGFLILSVYWFNPVIWLSYILLCRDIELACDEKVIAQLDKDGKREYSTVLLSCSIPRKMISACPLAFGETDVKQRIKSILSYKKPTLWLIIGAVAASLVITVCFTTFPTEKGVPFFSSRVRSVSADNATLSLSDDGKLSFGISSKSRTPLYLPANAMKLEAETEDGWQSVADAISEVTENADLFTLIENGNSYTVEGSLNPEVTLTEGARYRLVTTAYRHYPTKGTAQPTNIYVEFAYASGEISTEKSYVYNLPTGENTVEFDPGDYEFFKVPHTITGARKMILNKKDKTFETFFDDTYEYYENFGSALYNGIYEINGDVYTFSSYDKSISVTCKLEGNSLINEEYSNFPREMVRTDYKTLGFHQKLGSVRIDTNKDGTPEDYVLSGNTDMKRAFITAKNYYDHYTGCATGETGGYNGPPQYGSFKINSPHPVFAVDINGNYFIADEKGGSLHRYDIVFGEKFVELYEKGERLPFAQSNGDSTSYVCNSLIGYKNTEATVTFYPGCGINIKVKGKKNIDLNGIYRDYNDGTYVYTNDGKEYIFTRATVRGGRQTQILLLRENSPDKTFGDYSVHSYTRFYMSTLNTYDKVKTGVYVHKDDNGSESEITLFDNGDAEASLLIDGKRTTYSGNYAQFEDHLYLRLRNHISSLSAHIQIENNTLIDLYDCMGTDMKFTYSPQRLPKRVSLGKNLDSLTTKYTYTDDNGKEYGIILGTARSYILFPEENKNFSVSYKKDGNEIIVTNHNEKEFFVFKEENGALRLERAFDENLTNENRLSLPVGKLYTSIESNMSVTTGKYYCNANGIADIFAIEIYDNKNASIEDTYYAGAYYYSSACVQNGDILSLHIIDGIVLDFRIIDDKTLTLVSVDMNGSTNSFLNYEIGSTFIRYD